MNIDNIVIIGFMGSGKTTLGTMLSEYFEYEFIDTDDCIEKNAGMSITEIFEKYGEEYFRELEENTIKNVSQKRSVIISTGGGVIKNKNNIDNLKKNGIIIFLKANAEKIYNNTIDFDNRPLLNTADRRGTIEKLLEERTPLYEKYSDIIIDVSSMTVDESFEAFVHIIKKYYAK